MKKTIFGFLKKKIDSKKKIKCSAVVLAAGSSTRMMCEENKLKLLIGGIPVLAHTLRVFQSVQCIDEIIVVTREEDIVYVADLCKKFGIDKVTKVIRGGSSRMMSVFLGVNEVKDDSKLTAVHDGARPFVSKDVIERVVEKAKDTGAAVPVAGIKDTLKVVRNGIIAESVDRNEVFAVQTPQVFDTDLLKAALQKSTEDGLDFTDDSSAVANLGMQVHTVDGSDENIKITTPFDLSVAQKIWDRRNGLCE